MNFDKLETAWASQEPPRPSDAEIDRLQQALAPEIRRRARFNAYGVGMAALAALLTPLLAFANRHYENPVHPLWYWANAGVWTLVWLCVLVYAWRRWRRQRALARQPIGDLRSVTRVALSSVEAEIHDCRIGLLQCLALLPVQLVTLYVRFPPAHLGFQPFAARAAATLGLALLIGLPLWRHYRVRLLPEAQRHRQLLRDFDDASR